ncbi:MAG: ATP-binding protein [Oscillochloris sp.]|nr:ATP-binding protein [Oscillochloris sp.]
MATHGSSAFVNRSAEIALLLQHVAELCHGSATQKCLVNISGVYGIGKTTLLNELARQVRGITGLLTLRLDLPVVALTDKTPPSEVRRSVMRQLLADSDEAHALLRAGFAGAEAELDLAADSTLERVATILLACKQPVLLLINAEAAVATAVFAWLERGLLMPLANADRLVAVITSRAPLRWREYDTRRRAMPLALTPFSAEDTAAQIGVTPEVANAIAPLAIGLPLANDVARRALTEFPNPTRWGADQHTELDRAIIQAIYARIGADLTAELRCALEILSVVREFTIPLMQLLLPRFCTDFPQLRSQSLLLLTIKQLQLLDLVIWSQESLSYQIAPTLRRLLADAQRRSEPERYRAIKVTACTYYQKMLGESLVSRHIYLSELLWHTLDQAGAHVERAEVIFDTLLHSYLALPGGSVPEPDALADLRRRLCADSELAALLLARESSVETLLIGLDQYVVDFLPGT